MSTQIHVITVNEGGNHEPDLVTYDGAKAVARFLEVIKDAGKLVDEHDDVTNVTVRDGMTVGEYGDEDERVECYQIGNEWYRNEDSYGDAFVRHFLMDVDAPEAPPRPEAGATLYAQRDTEALGDLFFLHLDGMTREGLHTKSAIAAELAWRDSIIAQLKAKATAGCVRCGSKLDDEGFCADETCPFDCHLQTCPAGFMGHPDHPGVTIASCNCRTSPTKAQIIIRGHADAADNPIGIVQRVDGKAIDVDHIRRMWYDFKSTESEADSLFIDFLVPHGYFALDSSDCIDITL